MAVVAHGRNGAPDQVQIMRAVDACLDLELVVVAPHLSNSAAGDGAGCARDFRIDGHLAELRAVIGWARAQAEFSGAAGKMIVIGHSMGAYAALRIAADEEGAGLCGVLAISPVVSGAALIAARRRMGKAALDELATEVPGALEDWPVHDLLPLAARIAVPVAVMTGADDPLTPPTDAETLARALPDLISLDILPGEHHCPRGDGYAQCLGRALASILRDCRPR